MNITIVAGGGLALATGIIFINLYPFHFLEATLFSVIIGGISGILFGNLFDFQTLFSGYITGLIMGVMAPMIGAAGYEWVVFLIMIEVFILSCFCIAASSAYKA
ncbi:hypothetical protein [Mesobacillus boroniphilus]|nr:hypothetical protein [Mesobacillus boroniphilus]